MSKYLEKIRETEEEIAGEIVADRFTEFNETDRMEALVMLGRAQATDRISVALSAEVIRFLEHFEQTKLYRALGHPDFVTFLKHSGLLAVTKSRYYERKKILDKEGDPLFDALSVAGVPMAVRANLLPGDVTIDGENIIIKGESDTEDVIVRKDDEKTLLQSIRNLATSRRNVRRDLEAAKEKLADIEEKHDEKVRGLYDELDRARAATVAEISRNPHMIARLDLGLAFKKLTDLAGDLSTVEKDQFRDQVLEDVAAWRAELAAAYKTDRKAETRAVASVPPEVSDEDWFEAKLATVDLEDLDNETELAQQL